MMEMPSNISNKTKERAHEIIDIYIHAVKALEYVKAIILVGSLYTNKSCSSKYAVLQRMEDDWPALSYMNLLRLCHKNRFAPEQISEADISTMKEEYQSIFLARPETWTY